MNIWMLHDTFMMALILFRTLEEDLVQSDGRVVQIDACSTHVCLGCGVAQKAAAAAPESRAAHQMHTGTELGYHKV